jgi:ABC-type phosphate transport system substrate-binding protein
MPLRRTGIMALAVAGVAGWMAASLPGGQAAAPAPAAVDPLDALEPLGYQPQAIVSGTLRLAGSTTLEQAAAQWAEGFSAVHPAAGLAIAAAGSDAGWQALASGSADVALVSRPLGDAERGAVEGGGNRRLVVVPVAFERLVWIVNADNPVTELRWSPRAGVLSAGAADAAAITWGRLGAGGVQADVPVRVQATELGSGTRWHLDRLVSGTGSCRLEVREHRTVKSLVEAVAADRGGLGLIGDNDGAWPGIRTLAVAAADDGTTVADAVPGSARTPDCRPLFIALAVPREGDWPPLVREFVAYVLSYPGQLDVAMDGLQPLNRPELLAQRELLGWPVER